MKIIITFLRVLCGIVIGFAGCVALLNAPYQLLNVNFRFTDSGPFILVSLIAGSLMLWVAWRLIRGRRAHRPVA